MPIVSPEENFEFLIDAVPGLREEIERKQAQQLSRGSMVDPDGVRGSGSELRVSGEQATVGSRQDAGGGRRRPDNRRRSEPDGNRDDNVRRAGPVDPKDIIGQLSQFAKSAFPVDNLSKEERQRLSKLQERNERLQPAQLLPYGSVGSARIPGNPYSTDTRGITSGITNLGLGILNRVRKNRTDEFEGELSELEQQQQQNKENREGRSEFFKTHFPDFYSDAVDREQEVADREDEQTHEEMLQTLENGSPNSITTGDISNLRKMTKDLVGRWDTQISNYNNKLSDLDAAITQAKEQGRGTYNGQSMSFSDLKDEQEDLQSSRDSLQTLRDKRLQRTDQVIQQKAGMDASIYDDIDQSGGGNNRDRNRDDDMVSEQNRNAMPQNPEELRSFLEEIMRGLQQEGSGSEGTTDLSGIYE